MMQALRRAVPHEEFDYLVLMSCLEEYARPRDKITDLLKSGAIVRVKKGLYIFGPDFRRAPYSLEVLANLIYGPSYLSLDYALSHYGMIPERVESLTSVTCGKSKTFDSPVGSFTYKATPLSSYWIGVDLVRMGDNRSFLMATREKALADKIIHDRGSGLRRIGECETYLEEYLRIDPDELTRLEPERLDRIAQRTRSRKVRLLAAYLRRERRGVHHE